MYYFFINGKNETALYILVQQFVIELPVKIGLTAVKTKVILSSILYSYLLPTKYQ
jgi:hypothetical protein